MELERHGSARAPLEIGGVSCLCRWPRSLQLARHRHQSTDSWSLVPKSRQKPKLPASVSWVCSDPARAEQRKFAVQLIPVGMESSVPEWRDAGSGIYACEEHG